MTNQHTTSNPTQIGCAKKRFHTIGDFPNVRPRLLWMTESHYLKTLSKDRVLISVYICVSDFLTWCVQQS